MGFLLAAALSMGIDAAPQRVATAPGATPPNDTPAEVKEVRQTKRISVPVPPKRNGIFVGRPKTYDNQALQALLAATRARVSQVNAFDQTGLIARLGSLQGATVSQTQIGLQAAGLPVPGETTTATTNAANATTTVSATENKTVSNSPTSSVVAQTTVPRRPQRFS